METSAKIAVITGAGSGIGRASALALVAAGFTAILAGRRRSMLEETAALAKSPNTLVVPTDISVPDQIATLFETVSSRPSLLEVRVATVLRLSLASNSPPMSSKAPETLATNSIHPRTSFARVPTLLSALYKL
jgi:NAD(P)-dependent dehydrogenase (short-subunit alcohol dehydrogenase family)